MSSEVPRAEPSADEYETLRFIPWGRMDRFYTAAVQAIEGAVLNALIANETMVGRNGHRSPGLPHDRLRELLKPLLKDGGAYQRPAAGSTSGGCRVAEEGVRHCAGAARAPGTGPRPWWTAAHACSAGAPRPRSPTGWSPPWAATAPTTSPPPAPTSATGLGSASTPACGR
ncbi:hypothetical protein GCM10010377_51820 [Streptomyces viridiviolaceus]|uniref:P1 family peptidase n=1 Tax=Streptomyces viridiviolaceus TaxID=68282 RepID=A0ABW2E3A9_9ACTN|nr:P1 family peptidase [Streptomyces viridiviolaceus]GHB54404.1 hypothetical protein GCM10010377_51820 [Streptomyces viridiviolaceus]